MSDNNEEERIDKLSDTGNIIMSVAGTEMLKLAQNGDIFVKGRLAENDKEVVDGLREFLNGCNREKHK